MILLFFWIKPVQVSKATDRKPAMYRNMSQTKRTV